MPKVVQMHLQVVDLAELGYRIDFLEMASLAVMQSLIVPKYGTRLLTMAISTEAEQQELKRAPAVSKKVRKLSQKQERRIAQDVGGRVQPASGALPYAKGDVRKQGKLRIEAKSTYAKSFSITEALLNKIESHATFEEIPTIVVDFLDKHDNKVKRSVAIVPYSDWVRETNDAADVNRRDAKEPRQPRRRSPHT
jgi:hypothetical protein